MADDLYDQDFFLWTQAQAEALRAQGRGSNLLDYENLAEEIEALGRSDKREAATRVFRILEHLFKLTSSGRQIHRALRTRRAGRPVSSLVAWRNPW